MQLTILGCGTYIPELNRNQSGYLLQIGKQNLVFDFGMGAIDGLLKAGVQYYDIDYVFVTHQHADHCGELISLLFIFLDNFKFATLNILIFFSDNFSKSKEPMKR